MTPGSILLGDLEIDPPLFLAPMAGLTHSALRTLIIRFGGVGLLATEMLSARRLPSENEKVSPFLIRSFEEQPIAYQLFVTECKQLAPAIDAVQRFGADVIDLNLGCPAPNVRQAGGGSSLMNRPDKVKEIVAAARRLTNLPLTAKIRLGERLDKVNLLNFCRMLEGEGIDLLTVHARLRKESFCRTPRWEYIGFVKEHLSIPVVANGSISSVADAFACLEQSGADGLMIGRAAAKRPWIFAEIARAVYACQVDEPEVILPYLYKDMVELLIDRFRPERRLGRLKEFTSYFSENYSFGHRLWATVQSSKSMDEAWEGALRFFEKNEYGKFGGLELEQKT